VDKIICAKLRVDMVGVCIYIQRIQQAHHCHLRLDGVTMYTVYKNAVRHK